MSARGPFLFLIFTLIAVGLTSIYYRHVESGVPLTTGEQITLWQIEAEISFTGKNDAVSAQLTLPQDPEFELVEEFTASPAYGVHVLREAADSKVVWSKRQVSGPQTLYYQGLFKENRDQERVDEPIQRPEFEPWLEPYQATAQALLNDAYAKSGNRELLVMQLESVLQSDDQSVAMLLSRYSRTEVFLQLLEMAAVPSKRVGGLVLEDGRRHQTLVPLVQVYINQQWELFDLQSEGLDPDLPVIIWLQDSPALLDVVGGENSSISFSISQVTRSALQAANAELANGDLFNFGLYNLPIAEQNLFKGILLLPIGALVVVFLRVIVGVKCSGTFMPILIATSFIQTELLNGVLGFLLVVSTGLVIRSYLSHLNLLLVSRISAVVIVVIGIIVLFTIIAFRLGLTDALTITFFPMIIMAWTIERMSILWEEEGGQEVLVQGGGSLLVAVIAYLMMDNALIRHWAFNFLGVHALIMAAILLMGQYTGYRLSELRRFKPMTDD
ncbi:inactive transglutaminase family protein [Arenicella xantha]|uniref:Uncharacterized protein with transglutaminase domain n=1 Tax=Arenicella xantha TaxID=644221 RepID=A0A395JQI0_9GAMM|nr:inactive transglutaminase family protein [Arenicella xantha]RBP51734.1 uncharacterized protein with transglutaminase domain [Arenicella xantha]